MKKLRTRRQIALRRILAVMLCLLVLVGLSVLRKLPYLSPSSAIAAAEQDLACGPTEVLAQRQEGEATFLLSWNDQVLLANMVSLPSGGATYCLANPCTAPTGPGTPSKGSQPRASGFTTRTPVRVGGSGPAWSAAGRRRSLSASPGRKRRNPWRQPSSPLGRETSTSGSTILTQGRRSAPPTPKSPSLTRQATR